MHVDGGGGAIKSNVSKPLGRMTMQSTLSRISGVAKMEIRPTGLLDPEIQVRTTEGQVQDLLSEINERVKKDERVLITVLTIKFAEEVAEYLERVGVKAHYLHSEIDTLERTEIIKALRLGHIDVIVGINLLREGLDIPEVSLVAIFDADKQGFLRNERSLLQTIGRASRNSNGSVILYSDTISPAMKAAMSQTKERRKRQEKNNEEFDITPTTIQKPLPIMGQELEDLLSGSAGKGESGGRRMVGKKTSKKGVEGLAQKFKLGAGIWNVSNSVLDNISQPEWDEELEFTDNKDSKEIISRLEKEMHQAAERLDFERAANIRDKIFSLKNANS